MWSLWNPRDSLWCLLGSKIRPPQNKVVVSADSGDYRKTIQKDCISNRESLKMKQPNLKGGNPKGAPKRLPLHQPPEVSLGERDFLIPSPRETPKPFKGIVGHLKSVLFC